MLWIVTSTFSFKKVGYHMLITSIYRKTYVRLEISFNCAYHSIM